MPTSSFLQVEVKMKELGVTTHTDYKVSFMLDHRAMITVQTERYGVFDCKPLAFIWQKFPEHYNEHNTIMMDDLRRNYGALRILLHVLSAHAFVGGPDLRYGMMPGNITAHASCSL